MKNVIPFPQSESIEETAALWLVKIDQGELSDMQKQQLNAWLSHDPRHTEMFAQLAKLWNQLDALHLLAPLFPRETEADIAAAANDARARSARRPRTALFSVAASVAAVLALLMLLKPFGLSTTTPVVTEPVELVYQTELGKQSQATLKDGSRITLNSHSKLSVRYTEKERSIYLVDGEVHFEVAKNPARPFVVYAGTGEVRAIGTAFSVSVDDKQDVKIAVSEGTVQVVANSEQARASSVPGVPKRRPTTLTLKQGGIASYHDAIETHAYVDPEKIEQKLAWKNGKWIFDGETLADVIAEANRYTLKKIHIADPAIADLRIGGYFDAGDVDALLATLEAGFDIEVKRGADSIQLSSLENRASSTR